LHIRHIDQLIRVALKIIKFFLPIINELVSFEMPDDRPIGKEGLL
jgi:hypothetical protein